MTNAFLNKTNLLRGAGIRCFSLTILLTILLLSNASGSMAQQASTSPAPNVDKNTTRLLLDDIEDLRHEVAQLKMEIAAMKRSQAGLTTLAGPVQVASSPALLSEIALSTPSAANSIAPQSQSPGTVNSSSAVDDGSMEHSMEFPRGGPALKIRGFFDVNLGFGSDANPLAYPLGAPPHNSFQLGEFDLYMTSKLSDSVSFLSEIVFGSDATNNWSIDIERAQLTYKRNDYFEASAGRFHTAIGYYNTAFHHGTWFQTATGRPFMYYFEDNGGILPVHSVGITANGLVPRTGALRLHWIAELGNGENSAFLSQSAPVSPVQNFLSDKNHKAFNLAAYIKPEWFSGLQIGGSYYNDQIVPPGMPHVGQGIGNVYVVYLTPDWEFLNEGVLLRDKIAGNGRAFHTPLMYTQISRKFGDFRPYVRYQYVNVPAGDPLYSSVGLYEGPSAGLRFDFTAYGAFKVQYNRLYTRDPQPKNGVDSQLAFTF